MRRLRGDDAAVHGRDALGRAGRRGPRPPRPLPVVRQALPLRGAAQALRPGGDRRADAGRPAREAREPPDLLAADGLRTVAAAAVGALVAATALGGAHASSTHPLRVLVVGDS